MDIDRTPEFEDLENSSARQDIEQMVNEARRLSDKYKIHTTTHRA
jgi:hypothetical protein